MVICPMSNTPPDSPTPCELVNDTNVQGYHTTHHTNPMQTRLETAIGYLFPGWALRRLNLRAMMTRLDKSRSRATAKRKLFQMDAFLPSDTTGRER